MNNKLRDIDDREILDEIRERLALTKFIRVMSDFDMKETFKELKHQYNAIGGNVFDIIDEKGTELSITIRGDDFYLANKEFQIVIGKRLAFELCIALSEYILNDHVSKR